MRSAAIAAEGVVGNWGTTTKARKKQPDKPSRNQEVTWEALFMEEQYSVLHGSSRSPLYTSPQDEHTHSLLCIIPSEEADVHFTVYNAFDRTTTLLQRTNNAFK